MTQSEAKAMGICKRCNAYRKTGRGRDSECVATIWPSLNYRKTPVGHCALTDEERKQKMGEM